eukprot:gene15530-21619_t
MFDARECQSPRSKAVRKSSVATAAAHRGVTSGAPAAAGLLFFCLVLVEGCNQLPNTQLSQGGVGLPPQAWGTFAQLPLTMAVVSTTTTSLPNMQQAPGAASTTRRRAVRVCALPQQSHMQSDRDLDEPLPGFSAIAEALDDIRDGKFLLVLDDESRENEGDLIIAASKVTTEAMAFLVEYSSGVVCVGMEGKDLDRLKLPLMVNSSENEDTMYTSFTVTCDLRDGITTGISAADRAKTVKHMADPEAEAGDFRRPGHIFPLRARPGGVIVRGGHTEAAVDLARLAGLSPAGVLCEVVNKKDGSMARTPELLEMAKEHGLKCITIADLVRYRLRHEKLVSHAGSAVVDSKHGSLTVHTFKSSIDGAEHLALVSGVVEDTSNVLLHLHKESSLPDALRPSSDMSLDAALQQVSQAGGGVVVCLKGGQPEGGVLEQLAVSAAATTSDPLLECALAVQMLCELNVSSVKLLTADEQIRKSLKCVGIKVAASGSARVNGVEETDRDCTADRDSKRVEETDKNCTADREGGGNR